MKYKLGIIGSGNMATAILNGILNNKVLSPSDIAISDIDDSKLCKFSTEGIFTTIDNKIVAAESKILLFAIKPQMSKQVMTEIKPYLSDNTVISIMAGVKSESIRQQIGVEKLVRIMPNTPCLIGKGVSAICFYNVDPDVKEFVFNVFRALGEVVEMEEKYFDAVTAISGSGPAYVFLFIQQLIDSAIAMGFSQEDASRLVFGTFLGSTILAIQDKDGLENLIQRVTSKGGTTEAALRVFQERKLGDIIYEATSAAKNRSEELSKC